MPRPHTVPANGTYLFIQTQLLFRRQHGVSHNKMQSASDLERP